jgi:hypothetical protein
MKKRIKIFICIIGLSVAQAALYVVSGMIGVCILALFGVNIGDGKRLVDQILDVIYIGLITIPILALFIAIKRVVINRKAGKNGISKK